MNRRAIWILYTRELRSALRERTIVVNSILMPIFLYPVLLWVLFSARVFVQGLNEGFSSRVVFTTAVPAGHGALADSLQAREGIVFLGPGGEEIDAADAVGVPVVDGMAAMALLRTGQADAVVSFLPAAQGGERLPGNFQARVLFDAAENRSAQAWARLDEVMGEYRGHWITREAVALGLEEADRSQFAITSESISSSRDIGALLLGQMISFFLVIMVALGCFVPSVDTTAGERERSTWETLMTVAASRASVVTAKYLYVATLGIVAGTLNVVALFLSVGAVVKPLLVGAGGTGNDITFSIPLAAVPVMVAGAVALALFFAAAMMILASFARSFKDGQAMVQPVYWLVLLPIFLGQQTDRTLTPAIASVPVANVSMMIRDAVNGVFLWPLIVQTLAVTLGLVALCLAAARYVLRFEDFLIGSFDGSLWRFVRDRMGKKREPAT